MADEKRIQQMSAEFQRMVDDFFSIQCRYSAAMKEVQTKLEILDDEFQMKHRRNPIHHIESRLKSIQSMMHKLKRKNYAVSMQSAVENLMDIAGIRVICPYVQDVYTVADLLTTQDDVQLIEARDYIQCPKENGYRSLHLLIEIPVFLREGRIMVPVEVQIRTIAMDFWASLEHDLRYKSSSNVPEPISAELQQVSQDIAALDQKMQSIHDRIEILSAEIADSDPDAIN